LRYRPDTQIDDPGGLVQRDGDVEGLDPGANTANN
jgi:hypothetical protein